MLRLAAFCAVGPALNPKGKPHHAHQYQSQHVSVLHAVLDLKYHAALCCLLGLHWASRAKCTMHVATSAMQFIIVA